MAVSVLMLHELIPSKYLHQFMQIVFKEGSGG